jgi:hypothetical protein
VSLAEVLAEEGQCLSLLLFPQDVVLIFLEKKEALDYGAAVLACDEPELRRLGGGLRSELDGVIFNVLFSKHRHALDMTLRLEELFS